MVSQWISPIFQSDKTCIRVQYYLRHLEAFGLETSEYIPDGMLEAILLMGETIDYLRHQKQNKIYLNTMGVKVLP